MNRLLILWEGYMFFFQHVLKDCASDTLKILMAGLLDLAGLGD